MNMKRLENKIALITGGGTGIGAAIAKRFIEEGAKVCIIGRRKSRLQVVADSFPKGSVIICEGDVGIENDVIRMIQTAVNIQGELHILVNNAAGAVHGSVEDIAPSDWRSTLDVNLTGPFLTMHYAIPHMIKTGGSIINIASVGGLRSIPGGAAYCTSKAALIMLTQQASVDLGPKGIRCNVVCPGLVRTEMTDGNMDRMGQNFNLDREGAYKLAVKDLPLGKAAMPDEIAPLCAYLASSESSFMTGATLVIDGGNTVLDPGMLAMKG
jgi:meso-butanediol dehydrogenase / (S,S)-butanediol dehydrogenase / diacetyl reductase